MAKNKSFLQEAVVAAKEVREAAIQHAYKELEENLTPSIKEALAQKLEEDLDIEDLEEGNGAVAGFKPVKEPKPKKEAIKEEEETEETEEKETIEDEETETEESTEDETPEEDDELPEPDEEDKPETDEEAESKEDEEPADDTELGDLTVGQLKDLIATMVSAIAPEKPAEQPEDMVPADVEGKGEEETPIEAEPGNEEELYMSDDETKEDGKEETKDEEDVEINLNELLKELEDEEHDRKVVTHKEDAEFQKELDEVKEERDRALAAVNEMKETLKSTNLLNAKLSYTVRLLSKPLSESQRTRAIESLDEAQSTAEVKAIYRTLTESFNSEAKAKKDGGLIREHKGSASRAVGKSTAAPIVEVDPTVLRFQQLAGIKQW